MAENTATLETVETQSGRVPLRRSPAAHLVEMMRAADVTGERGVALSEVAFAVQTGVRAVPGTPSAQRVEEALGITLPTRHGQTTGHADGLHALWLSPDEFLVVDVSREQAPGEAEEFAGCLEGLPGQVLDLSANRAILQLSGPSSREVLEKGCPMDLHPRAFPVGTAVATQVGPVPLILHRGAEDGWRLYPRASFTDYMVRWLVDAMEEFGSEELTVC